MEELNGFNFCNGFPEGNEEKKSIPVLEKRFGCSSDWREVNLLLKGPGLEDGTGDDSGPDVTRGSVLTASLGARASSGLISQLLRN